MDEQHCCGVESSPGRMGRDRELEQSSMVMGRVKLQGVGGTVEFRAAATAI